MVWKAIRFWAVKNNNGGCHTHKMCIGGESNYKMCMGEESKLGKM